MNAPAEARSPSTILSRAGIPSNDTRFLFRKLEPEVDEIMDAALLLVAKAATMKSAHGALNGAVLNATATEMEKLSWQVNDMAKHIAEKTEQMKEPRT